VILKYVLRNFSRRKVRTVLMILALMVSIGLIVAMSATVESMRQSTVDLIASEVGRYDLSLTKQDTSPDPFIAIDPVAQQILAVDERIMAVHPRIEAPIEIFINGEVADGQLAALDPQQDDIGFVTLISGTYQLGDRQVAVLADTANIYNIAVGDKVDVSYSFPIPREKGQPAATAASERRATERFAVTAVVRPDGVSGSLGNQGLIMSLDDAQQWLDLPGQASSLIATVNPALYETNNAEVAALRVRDVVSAVQQQLGDEYRYGMDKALALNGAAQAFLMIQALINSYGLIALGVVGLLVHTLVMTNVQEQRRDMAIMRILGSQRNYLFALVMVEVLIIGLIGVGLGIVLGQLITRFIIVPVIQNQMAQEGFPGTLTPVVSLSALLPVIISAMVVLFLSSLQPAREAARTKVMHAINPGVADNIQIEDLARLRERRPDFKLFLGGLALMAIFALIAGFQVVEAFGGPSLQVGFVLLAIGLIVLGLGLTFYIVTVPFEKLVLLLVGLVFPRQTYFARRNVGRGQTRNTLISMLVLFSAVLPSFLATMVALEQANLEADQRQSMGAPADIRVAGWWRPPAELEDQRFTTDFRTRELETIPGVDQSVGLTYGYRTSVSDGVGFKSAGITAYGVDGYLNDILFTDLIAFSAGGPQALDVLPDDPRAAVISKGLADHLAVSVGDTVKIAGEGTDHVFEAHIIAVASRIPGFEGIGRSRISAQSDSAILFSLDGFRRLVTPLDQPLPTPDKALLDRVMFSLTDDAVVREMDVEFAQRYSKERQLWARFLDLILEENRRGQVMTQVFLLTLTTIAFTTAVFGVFAVIYVSIYARRIEIGMLKAMGMRRRELTSMLNIESVTMTLGAALAGITAGAAMGYIIFYGERALAQRPVNFAVDSVVIPFIVLMIVLASMISATLSARRIVRKRAVEILRM
jgi:ABC-type antimicrobial peptide transport system permease subunit